MANSGLPGTSGFIGEFMVILASFAAQPLVASLAALTLIIGAGYTLWMVRRVFYGEVGSDAVKRLKDLSLRETVLLGALGAAVLALGVWPAPLLELMDAAVLALVEQASSSKLPPSIAP